MPEAVVRFPQRGQFEGSQARGRSSPVYRPAAIMQRATSFPANWAEVRRMIEPEMANAMAQMVGTPRS